ncbi:N-acetylglucosaminyldiphosphoundecaprenol N-acetyl-beta-D-mannosaminyltransferase [Enterococcus sp. AZ194]|uniref:WecB/TagA/CpsF family glycosyltransferase n=1 Tax=Enterococcus sp. AZ194 TaxID=2774629 RepID=UPI003F1FEB27
MMQDNMMGIPVDALTYEQIVNDVPIYLTNNKKMTAISVNPQIVTEAKKYPEIVSFINQSTHRIPDGIGIVLVSKLTKGPITTRVAGIELMTKFLAYANEYKKSVFFYGAKPEVIADAAKNIQEQYPDLVVAGAIDGYTNLTEEEIIQQINQQQPDFLFVGLGFPRQEQWLARNVDRLKVSIFQDVGGSFDVFSGHVKRSPQFFIDYHLEWLYRSLSNPKRIGRIFQLPVFVWRSLMWKMRK